MVGDSILPRKREVPPLERIEANHAVTRATLPVDTARVTARVHKDLKAMNAR